MKRRLGWLLESVLVLAPAAMMAQVYGDFQYANNGTGVTITGYSGTDGVASVPSNIDGVPVTTIGSLAFVSKATLSSVTIPDSVTTIADRAFLGCANLGTVDLGHGITSIGTYTFDNCVALTNVTLPNSLTNIGNGAFLGCTGLPAIAVPDSVVNMGNNTFGSCTSLASVTLGNGITRVGDYAFDNCSSLTTLIIPEGVTSIGGFAFDSCSSLATISIPNSVANISINAFESCVSLTSLTFQPGISSISDNAFNMCTNLTSILFMGDAPTLGGIAVFAWDSAATVYYLFGMSGWEQTFGGLPTVLVQPPSISVQPQSVATNMGTTATFEVQASGSGPLSNAPLSYQWFFDDTAIDSATLSSYTVDNIVLGSGGDYFVVISDAAGSVTSSVAQLTVLLHPPSIGAQPQSVITNMGMTVTIEVQASGSGPLSNAPLSYQWFFNGAAIDSATLSSYTVDHLALPNGGDYFVVITNAEGSVTSSVAQLTVLYPHSATATISMIDGLVQGFTVIDGGYGYTNTPVIEIVGGGGSGARALAQMTDGVVTGILLTDAGSGYTNAPLVVIAPPFSHTLSIALTSTPGATATPIVSNGCVVGVNLTCPGAGYRTRPAVRIIDATGSAASGYAEISEGAVTSIVITSGGWGYSADTVITIEPSGSLFAVTPTANNLILGQIYQLEVSGDFSTWARRGPSFTATNDCVATGVYFDITDSDLVFLRLKAVPL